ncbi:formate/nitrite transporter family protein [Minwuia sp.]|uniref:formate/nitrite transporter family protein n=1 Tax=Minwuia sp. TaxID=2493630 RepID=UPI003A8D921D
MSENHTRTPDDPEKEHEREERELEADDMARPSAPTVYEVIAQDGQEEMHRPVWSLWCSAVAAGLGISISLYAMGALRVSLDGVAGAAAIEKLGYCVGFLIVMLGRLQLFTENTITPVLPALRERTFDAFYCVARLWTVVFAGNLVGTFCAAALPVIFPVASDVQMAAVLDISRHFADRSLSHSFFSAIPAGFLVAAMVWMMPSSKGFEIWTIIVITYVIAVADTSHVIVGSTELFTVLLHGEMTITDLALQIVVTGIGNIVGGTGLFAILAYAQVSEEL